MRGDAHHVHDADPGPVPIEPDTEKIPLPPAVQEWVDAVGEFLHICGSKSSDAKQDRDGCIPCNLPKVIFRALLEAEARGLKRRGPVEQRERDAADLLIAAETLR